MTAAARPSLPLRARGERIELRAGEYRAAVSSVGAMLESLELAGRPLVLTSPEDGPMLLHRGALIAPWPNRIGRGAYVWEGEEILVPVNEPERGNALHGLVSFSEFEVLSAQEDAVVLAHTLRPQPAYPFTLRLEVEHRLDAAEGLTTRVRALNAGTRTAPYGVCPHPYVVAGPEPLEEWSLELPAEEVLEVDENLLPLRTQRIAPGSEWDFRTARRLGDLQIDHAFTGLLPRGADAERSRWSVRVSAPGGTGVEVSADGRCPWVQVHTADRPEPENDRKGLALEPMTCPPDAFRSGTDLVRLEPGSTHEASWSIRGW